MNDITAENPSFDWELCGLLHNKIIDIGWAAGGYSETHDHRSWWEYHSTSHSLDGHTCHVHNQPLSTNSILEQLEQRLPLDLIKFLKLAKNCDSGGPFCFIFADLCRPYEILDYLDAANPFASILAQSGGAYQICLYRANLSHGIGILFNIRTMGAFTLYCVEDQPGYGLPAGMIIPLETILSGLLDMEKEKRIEAAGSQLHPGTGKPINPGKWSWNTRDNPEVITPKTVQAWDSLLDAIEEKNPTLRHEQCKVGYPPEALSSAGLCTFWVEHRFIIEFLSSIRIPNFKYIAPGLRLPTSAELMNQPFGDQQKFRRRLDPPTQVHVFPFVFLRTDQPVPMPPYGWLSPQWAKVTQNEAGLYLNSMYGYPDGCRLFLPIRVGENGWAKKGDLTKFKPGGMAWSWYNIFYDGLYQPGNHSHIFRYPALSLERLLTNWTDMVKNGHWNVGPDGVSDGIEKFKEADTEEKWRLYCIQSLW
ncbi:hypothetical protein BT63DRAFT_413794 [Microthyrium microscopicum]|uniref:Uncharacterized protein n=1 Tax=Microthyrium microscopicum TaxID=703497 RepID=A0A6A6UCI7_9PEZI|nr:hypothetical protein BT63DRAFT_413794 [Microthyrium microscopicum]